MIEPRHPISFVATSDPEAAKAFYVDVLDLTLMETSPYALVFADGESMLRVQIVVNFSPAAYTVHGWLVNDVEQEVEALVEKGVTFQAFGVLGQDDNGVWTSPDGHKIVWFKDPGGNILSLTQMVAH
jgi:catechol 2,3-dioxygenase-like lactoylglutathione lyase family enzyme